MAGSLVIFGADSFSVAVILVWGNCEIELPATAAPAAVAADFAIEHIARKAPCPGSVALSGSLIERTSGIAAEFGAHSTSEVSFVVNVDLTGFGAVE